jgi:hypothetical protein
MIQKDEGKMAELYSPDTDVSGWWFVVGGWW